MSDQEQDDSGFQFLEYRISLMDELTLVVTAMVCIIITVLFFCRRKGKTLVYYKNRCILCGTERGAVEELQVHLQYWIERASEKEEQLLEREQALNIRERSPDEKKEADKTSRNRDAEVLEKAISRFDPSGPESLLKAASAGRLEEVQATLRIGEISVEHRDRDGKTALLRAAQGGHLAVVQYLVQEAHAHIGLRDHWGQTALHCAACKGHLPVVRYLVQAGADTTVSDTFWGWTVLHWAAGHGRLQVVRYLVHDVHMEVSVRDTEGQTALHCAACNGHLLVVQYLVTEAGADVNVKDNSGQTPLHWAASNGHLDVVQFLVDGAGMNLGITDNSGQTALHCAACNDHLQVVQYLVQAGAQCEMKDVYGRTALASTRSPAVRAALLADQVTKRHSIGRKNSAKQDFSGNFKILTPLNNRKLTN